VRQRNSLGQVGNVTGPERVPAAAAIGFDRNAADYERARPSYPPAAIDLLRRELGVGAGARVCDLAAGTGKLTRLLVATGADVVAVEPVAGMRAQLAETVPEVEILDGTAEQLPFGDQSLDALTVAQAFHWFRLDEALAEIRRVLRPGGGLAVLFNQRDDREHWVAAMNEVLQWHQRTVSEFHHLDWAGLLGGHGYGEVRDATFEWSQPVTRELLAARVRSVSYVATEPDDVQRDYVDRVLAVVDGVDEPFDLPYITRVWFTHRA
jgi:SAM-dependent methyltransferase